MWKKISLIMVASSAITGCIPLIGGCGGHYHPRICPPSTRIEIEDAEVDYHLPAYDRVAVLPGVVNIPLVETNKLSRLMKSTTEQVVLRLGGKLVDEYSELAPALMSERIELNEVRSGIAEYAVWTELNKVAFKSEYIEEESRSNDKGEVKHTPASCKFSVDIEGIINVYDFTGMNHVNPIMYSSTDDIKEELTGSQCKLSNSKAERLLVDAVKSGIKYNYDLKQALAPTGKVLEVRQCDDLGSIVRVSLGFNDYVKPEMEVRFEKISQENVNGHVEYEIYGIGSGIVLPEEYRGVKPHYSWVHVSDSLAEKLKRGDIVNLYPTNACGELLEPLRKVCFEMSEQLM